MSSSDFATCPFQAVFSRFEWWDLFSQDLVLMVRSENPDRCGGPALAASCSQRMWWIPWGKEVGPELWKFGPNKYDLDDHLDGTWWYHRFWLVAFAFTWLYTIRMCFQKLISVGHPTRGSITTTASNSFSTGWMGFSMVNHPFLDTTSYGNP